MGPVFKEFAIRYPNALFLKIDVDECQDVAAQEGVTSMPTFFLFKAKVGEMNWVEIVIIVIVV